MADLTITAGSVLAGASAVTKHGTAGATITRGAAIYYDSAAGKWKLAVNDTAAHAAAGGIALNDASDGQPVTLLESGPITIGATVAVGTVYCVSNSGGKICPTADIGTGEFQTVLGIATTTAVIQVKINASGVAVPA